jgi:hypothetical protein
MKNDIIYLKEEKEYFNAYVAFDLNNWTKVRTYEGYLDFKTYDDIDNFNIAVEVWSKGCTPVTREEFNEFFKLQTELLNEITKEL